jgi:phage anti-repressor protein
MPNITLSIPEELQGIIKRHSEIRWSEVARQAMIDFAKKLEMMEKIAKKSKLSEEDAIKIADKIKSAWK